ncbi:putative phosphatase [Gaiella occulta]|uniref:Putative phosphatase n=1 Tax=Gaiella occulta TaxID=1002870 RepID=A0A7M2YVF8_9ACTN|nr:HAD family hydrolase [Gaiella occulta]RDI74005.1 putative phosphatase [Gaiella occulta]
MERPHAILFDVDGTLVETGGAGGESWRRAFRELYDVDADVKLFSEVGETDPAVGRRTFEGLLEREPEPAEMALLMTTRLAHVCAAVADSAGYRVLAGVERTLERLVAGGFLLGLTTGNVEAAAFAKLQRGGLQRFFCFGGYGSDSPDRGELTRIAIRRAEGILGMEIDTCRVLVVGDTPKDVAAAKAAHATSVAVASGRYSQADLRDAGAHYVLATLEEPLPGVTGPAA